MVRKRRFIGLIFVFLFITLFIGLSVFVARQQVRLIPRAQQQLIPVSQPFSIADFGPAKISANLLVEFQKSIPEKKEVFLVLTEPKEIKKAEEIKSTPLSQLKRDRPAYIAKREEDVNTIQNQVLNDLSEEVKNNKIEILDKYWIVNGLKIKIDTKWLIQEGGLDKIAKTKDIIRILPPFKVNLIKPEKSTISPNPSNIEWNIQKIHAPDVWEGHGLKGQNVAVASLDTGVNWTHPALKNKYRGWNGTTVNHDYNWFDATRPANAQPPEPYDDMWPIYHGTHTTGTMVGAEETINQIGVAPGAKWIAAKFLDYEGTGTFPDTFKAMQWLMKPTKLDGTGEDPSRAPDIVNNSWGYPLPISHSQTLIT